MEIITQIIGSEIVQTVRATEAQRMWEIADEILQVADVLSVEVGPALDMFGPTGAQTRALALTRLPALKAEILKIQYGNPTR
jgi:hypothetical protein